MLLDLSYHERLPELGALKAPVESKEQCSEQTHHRLGRGLFQIPPSVVKLGDQEVEFLYELHRKGFVLWFGNTAVSRVIRVRFQFGKVLWRQC